MQGCYSNLKTAAEERNASFLACYAQYVTGRRNTTIPANSTPNLVGMKSASLQELRLDPRESTRYQKGMTCNLVPR